MDATLSFKAHISRRFFLLLARTLSYSLILILLFSILIASKAVVKRLFRLREPPWFPACTSGPRNCLPSNVAMGFPMDEFFTI